MHTSITRVLFAALVASSTISATPVMKRQSSTSTSATTSTSFPTPGPAIQPADPNLITALDTASNTVTRWQKIQSADVSLVFPFNSGPNTGKGGKISVATRANFPPLVGTEISAAVGFIEPCGMNTLHTHPRAAEFLTVVQGTIQTGFILENGLTTEFNTTLNQYEGTVFPKGSVHFQFNPNCEPAVFVAGLNNEDPGATQIAQTIFEIEEDVVEATFGFQEPIRAGSELEKFKANIPSNVALGIQQCIQSCPAAQQA
ncbi:putative spherulin-1b precursor [Phaeomoniella chlamydospora]|uniref:Putative spherulin-1b n=1 Tax=Phaeomoniella chlamydospora TaxID=158046 RepID=A0A0G2EPT6_PHACM|nr:putative spherulin-1b precursor [Phaeomoniella chlamydospora]